MDINSGPSQSTRVTRLSIGAVIAFATAVAAANIYLLVQTNRLSNEVQELRSTFKTDMNAMQRDAMNLTTANARQIQSLRQQLEEEGVRSAQAVTQASSAARKYSDQIAKKLSEQNRQEMERQTVAQQEYHKTLTSQLGEMRRSSAETSTALTGLAGDVTSVKTDVAQTRTELEKTIGELRSVRGDMGLQSGLIATNARELAALKALGERDYFEFQLAKTKTPQKIADVAMQLKKSDWQRHRYTIELIADDKKVEKKDRNVNEPVQFYVSKARTPYEIVINEVRNDRIIGYLSAPKVRMIR
jgi:hypothetical protein